MTHVLTVKSLMALHELEVMKGYREAAMVKVRKHKFEKACVLGQLEDAERMVRNFDNLITDAYKDISRNL